ncbi:hypothetical protein ACW5F0_11410 [Luteimonas sp. A534]
MLPPINDALRAVDLFLRQVHQALAPAAGHVPDRDVGFDRSVAGSEPHWGFDAAMADVAGAVYQRGDAPGWQRVGDGELASAGIDPGLQYRDGMEAGVYTEGNGHYVVAYAGNNTGGVEDVGTVIAQSAGFQTRQYDNAVAFAHQVENAFGGDNVVYTGHSLGGGLASVAAAATGSTAVTFNGQGVHDNTLRQLGLDPGAVRGNAENGQMRHYSVDGDWATLVQRQLPIADMLPDPLGTHLQLRNPEGISNLANAHNIGPVKAAIEQRLPYSIERADPLERALQDVYSAVTATIANAWRAVAPPII